MKQRLRKKDRIQVAGRGNRSAVYLSKPPKKKWQRINAGRKKKEVGK